MTPETTDSKAPSIKELIRQFSMGSLRQRRRLIQTIQERFNEVLGLDPTFLDEFDDKSDNWSVGFILQLCRKKHPDFLQKILASKPMGWFSTPSDKGLDYSTLQKCLLEEHFEEADRITSRNLRELAGADAVKRGYVYFSEVNSIPKTDLETLDRLWIAYSQGRFGFSVQARILASINGRYDRLWPRIGWKQDGIWTRYPNSFNWSLDAPEGHMPLVNQLRGVRLLDALLNHPALKTRIELKP